MEKAIPNPEPVQKELSYNQMYYSKNKDKWQIYNDFEKIYCDVCCKKYKFIKTHLNSNNHKMNLKLKQKDDLLKSFLENVI